MSTDSTQPMRTPGPPPEEPQADPPAESQAESQAASPTVRVPVIKTPPARPPVAPAAGPAAGPAPARPAPQAGQAPPTQLAPRWQAPPPPPPPPGPQQAPQERPAHGDQAQSTRWERPQDPTWVDQAPPRPQQAQQQPTQQPQQQGWGQQWNQPPEPRRWEQTESAWTGVQPWIEPQDEAPPKRQPQAPGQWGPPPPQPPLNQAPAGRQPRFGRRQRKRRVRRSVMALFTVIVLLILLVIGDRVALAVTENQMAGQFKQNGLPVKPSVSIEGFPFLTQLAAKDFNKVNISASDIPVPLPTGGSISITSVHATIDGLHISSYSSTASARVDHINATAFVSFGALASAGGLGQGSGITIKPDGPNKLKITAGLGDIFSDTEEAQISQTGPQTISIKVLPGNSPVGDLLSAFGSFSFKLPPGVPPSLKITSVVANDQGLTISAAATNATFSQ